MKRLHRTFIVMFLLVLLIVIALHILNASLYYEIRERYEDTMKPGSSDGEPGKANEFGGAPKIEDPKGLEDCRKRVTELQGKIKKDEQKKQQEAVNEAKTNQKNDEERAKGYETQYTTITDSTKEAVQKYKQAEAKIPEATDKLNKCLAELNKLQPILDAQKQCCDGMRTERDNFIKMKNEANAKLGQIIPENNALAAKVQELNNVSTTIVNDINKCNTEVTEIRSQIDVLKNNQSRV